MYLGQNIKQILPGNVAVGGANMGMVPLFSVQWCPSRDAIWAGYVAADGQELDDNLFPDAAAGIAANNVPTTSNANWLSDPTARGAYVEGSSAGKFRVPDYNGKFAGSLGAVFLRGDGTLSAAISGVIQSDAFQGHTHDVVDSYYGGSGGAGGVHAANNSFVQDIATGVPISDGTNGTPRTASETRPLNVTGCWVIKLFGAVTNMASADAAQLASSYASLGARINALPFTKEFVSAEQVITAGGSLNISHDLLALPKMVIASLIVKTAFNNWEVGDEILCQLDYEQASASTNIFGYTCKKNTNSLIVRFGNAGIFLINPSTSAPIASSIVAANCRIIFRAYA